MSTYADRSTRDSVAGDGPLRADPPARTPRTVRRAPARVRPEDRPTPVSASPRHRSRPSPRPGSGPAPTDRRRWHRRTAWARWGPPRASKAALVAQGDYSQGPAGTRRPAPRGTRSVAPRSVTASLGWPGCGRGGIGSTCGFRSRSLRGWRFESHRPHRVLSRYFWDRRTLRRYLARWPGSRPRGRGSVVGVVRRRRR